MEKALVTAGIFVVPTILWILGFRLSGRKVEWVPLLWAGFACLVYVLLLRSRSMIPVPGLQGEDRDGDFRLGFNLAVVFPL